MTSGDDEGNVIAYRLGQVEAALKQLLDKVVSRERYEFEVGALTERVKTLETDRITGRRFAITTGVAVAGALAALVAVGLTIVGLFLKG